MGKKVLRDTSSTNLKLLIQKIAIGSLVILVIGIIAYIILFCVMLLV